MYNPLSPNKYRQVKRTIYQRQQQQQQQLSSGTNFLAAALLSSSSTARVPPGSGRRDVPVVPVSYTSSINNNNNSNMGTGLLPPSPLSAAVATTATVPPSLGHASPLSPPPPPPLQERPTHTHIPPPSSSSNASAGPASSTPPAGGGPALPPPPSTMLSLSAEELHAQRIQRSAAMGVQRAVGYQKDAFESDFKKRKLEGSDTRSRITSLLSQMKAKSSTTDSAGSANTTENGQPLSATASSSPSAHTPSPSPSAPLTFVRSGLRTGGFVMAPVADAVGGVASTTPKLEGQPSATLLLRYLGTPSLWSSAPDTQTQEALQRTQDAMARGRIAEQVWSQLIWDIRRESASFGVVSSCKPYVLTPSEEAACGERLKHCFPQLTDEQRDAVRDSERVRLLVRFDALAGAFKAAEAMSTRLPMWKVCFFPTSAFDAGQLGPSENEPWSHSL